MKKKLFTLLMAGAMTGMVLSGCGHEHEWTEATCTEPKTCATCGETEGEALGHTWVEATCTEPKTCSACGLTEGEALGHTLSEANYQQPATCSVCGATEGDVLTPAFVENNVKGQFMELGKTYDYVTSCSNDTSKKTTGHAMVTKCETLAPDETHEAKDGYEWKTVEIQIVFDDENANVYGTGLSCNDDDYYDIVGSYDSYIEDDNGVGTFTVHWNGEDYTECEDIFYYEWGDWEGQSPNGSITLTWGYEVLLPTGYDGRVISLVDYGAGWKRGQGRYIYDVADDNTLFFRMQ